MKKVCLIFAIAMLCCLQMMAQNDSVWTFSGKVIDAKTHKGMPYVSVTDRQVGTVTNEQGEFTLKLQSEPQAITFTYVGYKTLRLSAGECKALMSDGKPVRMQASSVVLSDIIIHGSDARDIVLKAIDKIEDNYPHEANLLRGFYRETVQKRHRFISVSEGVVC